MKKFLQMFKAHMTLPIAYKVAVRLSIGIILSLIWKKFINVYISVVGDGFFLFGLIFLCLAWFNYLQLDGLRFLIRSEASKQKSQKKKEERKALKSKYKVKTMVDYVDEEIPTDETLTDTEKMAVNLSSNLLTGLILIVLSLIAMYF